MEGEEGSIVARLDRSSEVSQGQEAELWWTPPGYSCSTPRTGAT